MIGQTLATYRLVEKLGEGGMGEVYRAIDEMLDRDVALKMLRPELARRQSTVDRFRAEAITLAKLDHPGIARIHGCSRHDDRWFIVMEFVRGETLLAQLARAGRLSWIEVVPIVCQLLDSLEYAHRRGVIHRDMKPANVLIGDEGRVKVTDFGIARVLGTERATRTGHIVGTLEYMSPEQVRGEEVDGRADLYAVGIVLYELLTGQVPFKGRAEFEVLTQHLHAPIPSVRALAPDVPAWFDEILRRALAKALDDRFPSASAFQLALEGYAATEPAMRTKATRLANAVMDAAVIGATGPLARATDPQAVAPTLPGPMTAPTVLNPDRPAHSRPHMAATRLASPTGPAPAGPAPTRLAAVVAPMAPTRLATAGVASSERSAGLGSIGGRPITWRQVTAVGAVAAVLFLASAIGLVRYLFRAPVVTPAAAPVEAPPQVRAEPILDAPPPEPAGPTGPVEIAPPPPIARTPVAGGGTPSPARPAPPSAVAPPAATPPAADHTDTPAAPAPAPAPAPRAEAGATAAAVEFEEVGLMTVNGDDLDEHEIVLRFESDRLVLVDADTEQPMRSIPYRSLSEATYARSKRPIAKAERDRSALVRGLAKSGGFFRRTPHWLTLEGAGAPIILKVDGGDIERVLSQLESRTPAKVERVSEK